MFEQAHDLIASPELRRSPSETISSQGSRLSWIGALPSPRKRVVGSTDTSDGRLVLRCRRTNGTSLSANRYFYLSYDYCLATIDTLMLICESLHLGLEKRIFDYMIVCSIERTLTKRPRFST